MGIDAVDAAVVDRLLRTASLAAVVEGELGQVNAVRPLRAIGAILRRSAEGIVAADATARRRSIGLRVVRRQREGALHVIDTIRDKRDLGECDTARLAPKRQPDL